MPTVAAKKSTCLYDRVAGIKDTIDLSLQVSAPTHLSLEGLTGTGPIQVQAKLHENAIWQTMQEVDAADGAALITFDSVPNYIRVAGLTAQATAKIFAQV